MTTKLISDKPRKIFYQSPNRILHLENLKRAREAGLGEKR